MMGPRVIALVVLLTSLAAAEPERKVKCDEVSVDDIMAQAENQYNSGFFSAALMLVKHAVACRPEPALYRRAVLFACAAHEAAEAKTYFAKLRANDPQRRALEQRCVAEHIQLH